MSSYDSFYPIQIFLGGFEKKAFLHLSKLDGVRVFSLEELTQKKGQDFTSPYIVLLKASSGIKYQRQGMNQCLANYWEEDEDLRGIFDINFLSLEKNIDLFMDELILFFKNSFLPYFFKTFKDGEKEIGRYKTLSETDEVTNLYNTRKLHLDLSQEIENYQFHKKSFSILFMDIDHFKDVNDHFGHLVGSRLLLEVAEIIRASLRNNDSVYRYGGDEFIALLPEVKIEEVYEVALRVLNSVKKHLFSINNKVNHYSLSLSIGIAEFPKDANSLESIIEFADRMMYMSKDSGRGKIFHVLEVQNADTGRK